jgi:uncharacterized lipoprotein YmbA
MVVLSACAGPPPPRTYVLGNPADNRTDTRVETGRPVVEIRPVTVPDYLDSRDILTRRSANELVASTTGRWGERLSVGIARALAGDLARRLPNLVVTTVPPIEPASRQVLVDVVVFEVQPDGTCVLGARWTILGGGRERKIVRSEYNRFVVPAGSHNDADIAAAMTQAIDKLADGIAGALGA